MDVIDLLARLVACPSVNPRGQPPRDPAWGEAALAALLGSFVAPWGARTTVTEIAPGRVNFLAWFRGRDSARRVLLEAHADTVPVEGMAIPPFEPAIRDGRLYGRGACDTKGAMAAMLAAIHTRVTSGRPLPCDLCFAATCNEEFGGDGAKALAARESFAWAVVGEPTSLEIVRAHKGVVRFRIEARGVAAHSSLPQAGASAIAAMARVVGHLEGPHRERIGRLSHPLLGSPAISVGTIAGGTQVNVVPDLCAIEVDRRTLPDESNAAVLASLRAELAALEGIDPRVSVSCDETESYPPLDEPADGEPAALLSEACRRTLGKARFAGAPWASDAGIFKAAGIPSVLFGPGSIRQAHTQDEYVELDQVRKAVTVYETLLDLL